MYNYRSIGGKVKLSKNFQTYQQRNKIWKKYNVQSIFIIYTNNVMLALMHITYYHDMATDWKQCKYYKK